jgi:hypothetical protein
MVIQNSGDSVENIDRLGAIRCFKLHLDRLNNRFLRENMEYQIVVFLHFPKEFSYGYLRFEGSGKIPLGR